MLSLRDRITIARGACIAVLGTPVKQAPCAVLGVLLAGVPEEMTRAEVEAVARKALENAMRAMKAAFSEKIVDPTAVTVLAAESLREEIGAWREKSAGVPHGDGHLDTIMGHVDGYRYALGEELFYGPDMSRSPAYQRAWEESAPLGGREREAAEEAKRADAEPKPSLIRRVTDAVGLTEPEPVATPSALRLTEQERAAFEEAEKLSDVERHNKAAAEARQAQDDEDEGYKAGHHAGLTGEGPAVTGRTGAFRKGWDLGFEEGLAEAAKSKPPSTSTPPLSKGRTPKSAAR